MAQAQVVQATCPGCKAVLQIPADWLRQPIKCKNCGTVMQARGPVTAAPPPLPPAPTKRPVSAKPPAVPAPKAPPPPVPAPPRVSAPSSAGFDFDGGGIVSDTPAPSRRRPRKKGKPWIGLAILGGFVLAIGGVAFAFKDRIRQNIEIAKTGKPAESAGEELGTTTKSGTTPNGKGAIKAAAGAFPRRALIIDVHNYLYANPINDAPETTNVDDAPPNVSRLIRSLNLGLRIPLDQIVRVSDNAKKSPLPPLKKVVEEGLVNFLKTCRKQDRILVFFIGHTREVGDQPYLVPLEGEFENVETLVPLKWVYEQLAKCEARQKILVLDGNRFNSAQGEERPSAGPLGEKFQAALLAPPAGVQVMAACSAGQLSQEFEESSLGAFLDSFRLALTPEKGMKGALEGRIQKPDDEIPVKALFDKTNAILAEQVGRRKLKQVALMAGAAPPTGAAFDPTETPAALPAMPVVKTGDIRLVREIMADISLPPLKGGEGNGSDVLFTHLPPFPEAALDAFKGGTLAEDSKLRQKVNDARITLWAISTATAPGDIKPEVDAKRAALKVDLSVMQDRYTNPGAAGDVAFKTRVTADATKMAIIVAKLTRTLEDLTEDDIKAEVKEAPKRWQANYEFLVARCNAEIAYLEEYEGLLGQIRKAYPEPFDEKVHSGWKMASKQKASDALGKKYDKEARKRFGALAEKYPNTPWAVLSKRENLTALGLDWQAY